MRSGYPPSPASTSARIDARLALDNPAQAATTRLRSGSFAAACESIPGLTAPLFAALSAESAVFPWECVNCSTPVGVCRRPADDIGCQRAVLVVRYGTCGEHPEQVETIQTPDRTPSWVPHRRLLAGVQSSLERAGLAIVSESHGLTRDGLRYFGLLQVANGENPDDFRLVVGVRNSHDKSFPAALALGASVFVCDNLSFSGEVKLARKHTAYIERNLPQLVDRAVGMLGGLRHTQESRFLAYKSHELSEAHAHDLVIQALDGRVVPVTRIPDVLHEWREPRHPEFREGRTAWRLFNAFTEILKGRLDELPRRTQALHGLMDAACGLTGLDIGTLAV